MKYSVKRRIKRLVFFCALACCAATGCIFWCSGQFQLQSFFWVPLVFAVLCLAFLYVGGKLADEITEPVKKMNETAQRIVHDQYDLFKGDPSFGEIEELSQSFTTMTHYLNRHVGDLNGLAYRDSLTGVKNRTAYQEAADHLDRLIQAGEAPPFAVVMVDTNYLKETNNTYGHDFGDVLIKDGCALICKTFKHSPVYRIGGDEFVVILQNEDLKNYKEVFQEFDHNIERHNRTADQRLRVSVSRGIAWYDPQSDHSFAEVFKRADDAMYENKREIKSKNIR